MNKRGFLLFLAVLFIFLTGCEQRTGDSRNPDVKLATALSPDELYEKLTEAGFFDVLMVDIAEFRLDEYQINPQDAERFIAKEAAHSSLLVQLMIIEAKPGRLDEVYNAMHRHRDNLVDAGLYPQGQANAMSSIVGFRGNVVYFICDESAADAEKELVKHFG
jgi:hypothetical protein